MLFFNRNTFFSYKRITVWKYGNRKTVTYSNLKSNDEASIIKWLYLQGFKFVSVSGKECHDIGDTNFFSGSIRTNSVDAIIAFVDKLYGEWVIYSTYQGTAIEIKKLYPNISSSLSFDFSGEENDGMMMKLFKSFEREFCHSKIKKTNVVR